jgi:hypothetical protein
MAASALIFKRLFANVVLAGDANQGASIILPRSGATGVYCVWCDLLVDFSFSFKIFFCHYVQLAGLNFLLGLAPLTLVSLKKPCRLNRSPF